MIGLPLAVSMASFAIMNFTDRLFLLWHNPTAMAAALPTGMLYFSLICFPLGLTSYVNTFVSQYYGAKRKERIGLAVWQGVLCGVLFAPVMILFTPLAAWIFRLADHSPEIIGFETQYFQTLAWGGGGAVIAAALTTFFTGRGKTRIVMVVDCAASFLNILLDYLLIFGAWGFPEWGIFGAGLATAVCQWIKAAIYWQLLMRRKYRETYGITTGMRFDGPLMRRLWYYGGPSGLQMVIEVIGLTAFILFIGRLGEEPMIATTLAFNINSVAFVPLLGMGIAVSTLVGQQLGEQRPRMAARATWSALILALIYSAVLGAMYLLLPDLFLVGHARGMQPDEFEGLRHTVEVLLRFVAAFCLLDAMQVVFVGALKGAGDTRFILIVSSIMAPLPVAAAFAGMYYAGWGLYWCWVVITAWISLLGIIYWLRFLQGKWRTMKVIEDTPVEAPTMPLAPVDSPPTQTAPHATHLPESVDSKVTSV